MQLQSTIDHEEIRLWIEEQGGEPALTMTLEMPGGMLAIQFDDLDPDYQTISWEEFFDMFESRNMIFCYDAEESEDQSFSYSFADREEIFSGVDDESELPQDDVPEENLFPSAPAPDTIMAKEEGFA